MPKPILPPKKMAQIVAMAANPALLQQLTEPEANALEYMLKHAQDVYGTCMMFRAFPDEGKFARKHYRKHVAFMNAGKEAKERGFVAANRVGKALVSSEPIPTTTGFTPIGLLTVGDYVLGSDGRPTRVTGVFPQGIRQVYRLITMDTAEVLCDRDHLWTTYSPDSQCRIRTTHDLYESRAWDELPPRPITVGPWRAQEMRIKYIERLPRVASMCCITVAAEDGIFLAGHGYVPTHNSFTIGYEDALHITGMYPDWWKGRLFNEPVEWLVSGLSNESTRKVLTPLLLGKVRQLAGRNYVDGSGMIPASHFVPGSLLFRGGSGRIVSEIDIYYKDSKEEFSTLYIMSNEQGFGAFSGSSRHGVHLDEEHDLEVYSECLTRTATTEGLMMTSFTPLSGITRTVMKLLPEFREQAEIEERIYDAQTGRFDELRPEEEEGDSDEDALDAQILEEEKPIQRSADGLGQWVTNHLYVMRVGWQDKPPHLTKKEMEIQIETTPPFLRDAKTKGIPVLGSGRVYPIDIEMLKVEPFQIPSHWPRAFALDPGVRATAAIWGAFNADEERWYLYREYKEGYAPPYLHAQRIKGADDWIPGVVDPAGIARSPTDGLSIVEQYRTAGLNITPAENSVSAGIQECYSLMTTGRLKIFRYLSKFESEFLMYRYNENPRSTGEKGYGSPVKKNDHILDATRYLIMSGLGVATTYMRAAQSKFKQRGGWLGDGGGYGDSIAGY